MPEPEEEAPGPPSEDEQDVDDLVQLILGSPAVAREYGYLGPGVLLAERFELGERLGAGGMGHVFAAFDRVLQTRVALKMIGKMTPRAIERAKREFRAASDLVHPNLVKLHELFNDGGEWYFAMELVDGVVLNDARGVEVHSPRFRDIFRQLASALHALHQAGLVHADLKPSNFSITKAEGRVVLLDFGLSRPIGSVTAWSASGTPAYMAPEQALGRSLTAAADWYAFGVVLYEALSGALPHPRPSTARLTDAPADLAALCVELLRLAPEARPSGEVVLARLGAKPARSAPPSLPPQAPEVFVGRGLELARLGAAFDTTLEGKPSWLIVEGRSGIGKTALCSHFAALARARGASVVEGHCRERESMGYKAVDGLIDGIVSVLSAIADDEVEALLPSSISDLTILFPALRAVRVIAARSRTAPSPLNHAVMRMRAVRAFKQLLAALRARAPLVLWIDDTQWADEESSVLLAPVIGGDEPVPLLFVACKRSGQAASGLLEAMRQERNAALPEPVSIELDLLSAGDAACMAQALLPAAEEGGADVAQDIGRDAGGHPLFIAELVHSHRSREQGLEPSTTLAELVSRRIEALATPSHRLLEALAVAGAPVSKSVLRSACGMTLVEIDDALRALEAGRLARTEGLRDQDSVDIHHDRIRDIALHGIDAGARRQHHASLARAIDIGGADKLEFAAGHYEAAGGLEQAAQLWLLAADRAAAALAFNHAAELYARGTRNIPLEPAALRAVQRRWAHALACAGKGPAAADVYLAAAEHAPPLEVIELQHQAAEQLLLSGHLARGMSVLNGVLAALGLRRARRGWWALASFLWGRLRLRWRGLRLAQPSSWPHEVLARLDATWSVSCSLGVIDPISGADFQTRHLMFVLDAGEPRRALRALSVEMSYAAARGAGTEARTQLLLAKADELMHQADDPAALGLLQMARGLASYLQGALRPALSDLEQAIETLTRRSPAAVWETITARRFFIANLFFLGDWRRLGEVVPTFLAEAEGTGNLYASMCYRAAYACGAWLVRDDVSECRRQLERASQEWKTDSFQLCHCNILIGQSYLSLYEGDAAPALERLVALWPSIRDAQLFRIGVLEVQLLQLRAGLSLASADEHEAQGELGRARALRRAARGHARRLDAHRLGRAGPIASLVHAALDIAAGRPLSALGQLEAAALGFEREHMRLFAAAARFRLGQLTGESTGGAALLADARAVFAAQGIVRWDRVIEMLAPGFRPLTPSAEHRGGPSPTAAASRRSSGP
jgi:hypothetical protein